MFKEWATRWTRGREACEVVLLLDGHIAPCVTVTQTVLTNARRIRGTRSGLHDLGLERAGASQPIFIIAGRRVVDVNPLLVQPAQNLRLAGPGRYSARLMP